MLGSIYIGIVWGWLVGSVSRSSFRNLVALAIFTLLLAGETFYFTHWRGSVSLLIATAASCALNRLWRQALREHFTIS